MPAVVIVGSQWGDEGKGKFIDYFAKDSDVVVRFQGGANAGHTLIVGGKKTVLHLVPSGVLHSHTMNYIGSGVALDPFQMKSEIDALNEGGLSINGNQLKISGQCTLVLPFHKQLDIARERSDKIGTTQRGIGPCYEDRASRRALLFQDLFANDLEAKLEKVLEEKNCLFTKLYDMAPMSAKDLAEDLKPLAEFFKPYLIEDISQELNNRLDKGEKVLFEGAQGTLLDIFHGTYPYVTSSSTVSASACLSTGVAPSHIKKVVGITKAYCTRVGAGPFPTEQINNVGEQLQKQGHEFGATTGRPRRCGWLDLVSLKKAVQLNGITEIVLTKIDVLNDFDSIQVCHGYSGADNTPLYKEFSGWSSNLTDCKKREELPKAALDYLAFIESEVNTPIRIVSVGPDRAETLGNVVLFE